MGVSGIRLLCVGGGGGGGRGGGGGVGGVFFFFNDTATTEIYTLSLHDALPISNAIAQQPIIENPAALGRYWMEHPHVEAGEAQAERSEEHTSELQSPVPISYAVFCLKKKNTYIIYIYTIFIRTTLYTLYQTSSTP